MRIDFNHHDRDLIAYRDHILWPHHLVVGQLRCTHQTLFPWQNLYETAKVYNAAYRACINAANLDLLCERRLA